MFDSLDPYILLFSNLSKEEITMNQNSVRLDLNKLCME